MELYQIRYFLAVARSLHFTQAAEEAGVSQPALTKAVRKLEEELGAPLFLRQGRQVLLTDFGRVMREKLERVVAAREEAEEAARQFLKPAEIRLNAGVMCTLGPRPLLGFLDRFRLEHPNIELHLHDVTAANAVDKLKGGEVDCAVLACPAGKLPAPLKGKRLYRERMIVAFSRDHRFNTQRQVRFEELDGERYIDRLHCEFRSAFLDRVGSHDMSLTFPYASEREDWIQAMIANGMGIGLLPEFSVLQPDIAKRPVIEPRLYRSVELAYLPGREASAGVKALVELAGRHLWPQAADN
ncbi:LysR family transcriptional regulator [Pelagibius sp. CAU 1746]|uniref:LysR family transcriptional regulator n=1 Tax=Pelagibius sp. CAU 1746 TaxID=3140370 RepID=UPI00325B7E9C